MQKSGCPNTTVGFWLTLKQKIRLNSNEKTKLQQHVWLITRLVWKQSLKFHITWCSHIYNASIDNVNILLIYLSNLFSFEHFEAITILQKVSHYTLRLGEKWKEIINIEQKISMISWFSYIFDIFIGKIHWTFYPMYKSNINFNCSILALFSSFVSNTKTG